jgi:hypothetical protein
MNDQTETERKFQKATIDMRYDKDRSLEDIDSRKQARTERRLKLQKRAIAAGAVGATAMVTVLGLGHQTVGEGFRSIFKDDAPTPTSPLQNEQQQLASLHKTGHLEGSP